MDIALFHSALGVRPGVRDAASILTAAGHRVHVIDLFDGRVFDDYEKSRQWVEPIGFGPFIEAAAQQVGELPDDIACVGFSAGAAIAQTLCATRPGVRAAVLLHGAAEPAEFQLPPWPGIPVQVHYGTGDAMIHQPSLEAFATYARTAGGECEVFAYPVTGHLFTDASLPAEYDAGATEQLWSRVTEFLRRPGVTASAT